MRPKSPMNSPYNRNESRRFSPEYPFLYERKPAPFIGSKPSTAGVTKEQIRRRMGEFFGSACSFLNLVVQYFIAEWKI